jgi:hypothetical protein
LDESLPLASTRQSTWSEQYVLKLLSVKQAWAGEHASKHAWLAVAQVSYRSLGAGPSSATALDESLPLSSTAQYIV